MRLLLSFITAICIIFSPVLSFGQEKEINGNIILRYVKALADDLMQGRKSGLPGGEKAANYIAGKFKEWGIEPAGEKNTYFQHFALRDFFNVEPPAFLEISSGRKRKRFYQQYDHEDWRICRFSGSGAFEAEIVFVGYGIHAPDSGYDDYAGIDTRDKIVLMNIGYPKKLAAKLGYQISLEKRIEAASNLGAKCVMIFWNHSSSGRRGYPYAADFQGKKEIYRQDFVILGINSRILDFIFDELPIDILYLFDEIEKDERPRSFNTGVEAKINVRTTYMEQSPTANVLGKISGSDPELKEEYIILGAHMDHLGVTPENEALNGAYDNASGTAIVMEVARLMEINGIRPKRTVVFALWAAEEQAPALIGSKYFVNHPLFPLEKTVVNINLDCIGQGNTDLYFGGVYHSPELWDIMKTNMEAETLNSVLPKRGHGGGDHFSFLVKGVPAFRMVNGRSVLKLHHPRDDWDLILPEELEKAGRFLYEATLVLSQRQDSLLFPNRAAQIRFKGQNLANFFILPSSFVLERMANIDNPYVNIQLIFPDKMTGADPSDQKLRILKFLMDLPEEAEKAPGLVIYEHKSRPVLRYRERRLQLIAGLSGSSSFKDDPGWLSLFSKMGLQFVVLSGNDLEISENKLTEETKAFIRAAERAKVLLIVSGLNETQQKEILSFAKVPIILKVNSLPSQECLKTIKDRCHVLALIFSHDDNLPAYLNRLRKIKEILGVNRFIAWNDSDLWKEEMKEKYFRMISILMKENWNPNQEDFSAHLPDVSPIFAGTFTDTLRNVKK